MGRMAAGIPIWKAISLIQEGVSWVRLDISRGDGKKQLNLKCILAVEITGLTT